jgi:hypothetical protein
LQVFYRAGSGLQKRPTLIATIHSDGAGGNYSLPKPWIIIISMRRIPRCRSFTWNSTRENLRTRTVSQLFRSVYCMTDLFTLSVNTHWQVPKTDHGFPSLLFYSLSSRKMLLKKCS